MATLREIKRRIGSIKSTQQITKAMKMVAAAKLRRAQENIFAVRPYAYKVRELIGDLMEQIEFFDDPLLEERPVERALLVVVTADRGLCGAFNSNIIRRAIREIEIHPQIETWLVTVGKKGNDFFAKRDYRIENSYLDVFNNLQFDRAKAIVNYLIEAFVSGKVDQVKIVYNEFKSVIQQNLVVEQFLPITRQHMASGESGYRTDYIYEPSKEAILKALLPKHLNVQFWRVLLESFAAEQGARMTAMENATDNATELIYELTLQYNKARQAAITKEISEIVGGAEALKSSG
ncbi:MAG: ATP synthase F1 subunit gamma [Calditrichaeota bacterium]|nr:ATP synthase F1 subunit gamma [Calditrichota bacterium]